MDIDIMIAAALQAIDNIKAVDFIAVPAEDDDSDAE